LSGVELHKLRSRTNYDPYFVWQLIKIIGKIKPDVIQTWALQMDILGAVASKMTGVPWILYEQSSAAGYPPSWKTNLRVRIASSARIIVSNSAGGDDYWKSKLSHACRRVIPNGLPLQIIDKTAAGLPGDLIKTDAPIVLFVGRLRSDSSGNKNLKPFLEALAYVKKQQQDVYGILCGEGPQRPDLELLTRELGLEENVRFTGHLPSSAVWSLIKSADVFVSLSAFEGRPNTVMEAMACHCPVILSDIPAHREITDDTCAMIVDPLNIEQIGDAIIESLRNKTLSKSRALSARLKVSEWTVAQLAGKFARVYESALNSEKSPGKTGQPSE
jgi:glycosyltransferase involved in cell wall biosynthesis